MTETWVSSTVGEQFDLQLGKMLDSAKNVGVPKPYLGNRAVQWGRIDVSAAGIVPLTRSDLKRYRLREGDLLVCEGGEVGRGAIWRNQLPECYFQKALHRLRPKKGYDARVMQALLQYWSTIGAFSDYVTQTSIAHLPREKFILMPLPLPAVAEQRRIGDALQHAEDLITTFERLIAKKRAINQGMLQQLLTGRTRLPGFDGPWREACIGDLFEVIAGGDWDAENCVKMRDSQHPYPVVANALTSGSVQGYCSYFRIPGDTLTITGRGDVGQAVYRAEPFVPIVRLLALVPRCDVSSRFFANYINYRVRFSLESTGVPQLTAPQVRPYLLAVPPVDEQRAIADVLADSDTEIELLQHRLAKTRAIKTGMVQQLLTGRTRLPVEVPS